MYEASPVAPPVASRPAQALVEKLGVRLQGCLDFALGVILDPGPPSFGDQPPGKKVVIVSVEYILTPFFVLKAIQKVVALQNLGPVGAGTARHTRSSTIDIVGS